ncbi:unnamed protein product [Heterosigma akashiwo]
MTSTEEFWAEQANKFLLWSQPFRKVCQGSFQDGDIAWFVDGKLNAAACCLDQHLPERANQVNFGSE